MKPLSPNGENPKNDVREKSANDPLAVLNVFERLEVGPVRLEPRRLVAPYRLFYNGKMDQTELIYSYEETVFDPSERESRNLADMIAAQLAINYGLFCDTIVFHGLYDDIDRRFIRDMAENTAREIYVKNSWNLTRFWWNLLPVCRRESNRNILGPNCKFHSLCEIKPDRYGNPGRFKERNTAFFPAAAKTVY